MSKYVFLDRDNTLVHDEGYLHQPEKVEILPGVLAGLRLLQLSGFQLVICTNQSGIGRGKFSEPDMRATNQKMLKIFEQANIHIQKIYFCPHLPADNCDCRKPADGMLRQAQKELGITGHDFSQSYFIGDKPSDTRCGLNLNIRGILLKREGVQFTEPELAESGAVFFAADFEKAVGFILEDAFEKNWQQKVIPPAEIASWRADIKHEKIVFTNGCFDLLHPGHIQYLRQASNLGDLLIVGVNDDKSVKSIKGPERPINPLQDRLLVLANFSFIDKLTYFGEDTPIALLEKLKPHIHIKGGDYQAEKLPEYKTVTENGGEVVILPFRAGYSSTKLISQLRNTR